jgi:hypothetical protein
MMNMYEIVMLMIWDMNACLTSRGVTLILMAPCCPIPSILISLGVSTLEAPNEKDMYSSYILIISIKHLCFPQCVLYGYYSFSMFYNRLVADHHPFSSSQS